MIRGGGGGDWLFGVQLICFYYVLTTFTTVGYGMWPCQLPRSLFSYVSAQGIFMPRTMASGYPYAKS